VTEQETPIYVPGDVVYGVDPYSASVAYCVLIWKVGGGCFALDRHGSFRARNWIASSSNSTSLHTAAV
jgi:hypothetical protein